MTLPEPQSGLTQEQINHAWSLFVGFQSRLMQMVWQHRVVVYEKSRRIGVSWTVAFIAVLMAALDEKQGGMDVFYLGYDREMTREFIDYCAEDAQVIAAVASNVQEHLFDDPDRPEKDIKIFRIDMASGHKILALPSVPRALRGKQGLVIIDEAAFVDNLEEMIKAALALLMWGGKVLIVSTHNGETNPFNQLVQDTRSGRRPYEILRTTLDDALADGLFRKICEKTGEVWSEEAERTWRDEQYAFYGDAAAEELDCIPSQSSGAYLPLVLIEARSDPSVPVISWACKTEFTMAPEHVRIAEAQRWCEEMLLPHLDVLDRKTPHVVGTDFGRTGDLSVFWPMAMERSLLRRTPFVAELRNVPFEQQKQILHFILDRLPLLRAVKMDARGNGQYLAEVTMQKYGSRVEAVMISEGWYRDNMPPMKAAFEDGTLTIPADRDIQDDLQLITMIKGVARIPEKRTSGAEGQRHGDGAVALCMAWAASRENPEEYGYQAAPARAGSGTGPDAEWPVQQEIDDERAGRRDLFGLRGSVRL